jgi:predicted ester cyclase
MLELWGSATRLTPRRETMLTRAEAHHFAEHWVAAWNAHDLDRIMAHYEAEVELISPVAAQLLNDPQGRVVGKANLRAYFQKGLAAYPELHFELHDVMWGVKSIVLYYTNQRGTHTGEYMELSPRGQVVRVVANYSG